MEKRRNKTVPSAVNAKGTQYSWLEDVGRVAKNFLVWWMPYLKSSQVKFSVESVSSENAEASPNI